MKPDYMEMLAQVLADMPEDQREFVAAHLLGTVQGMKLEMAMQKEKESA